jgi:REP element-mobilizing transposase RayT
MARGTNKQEIFRDETDFTRYLMYLEKYRKKIETEVFCFVLMPNHIHFILRSKDGSKFMHLLQTGYSVYFNRKYEHQGHVFQGRFENKPVMDDVYLLYLSKYIHMNPVKAGLVKNPDEYSWSSYRTYKYFGKETERFQFVDTFYLPRIFFGQYGNDEVSYQAFVEEKQEHFIDISAHE